MTSDPEIPALAADSERLAGLRFEQAHEDGRVTLSLFGEVDIATAPALSARVQGALAGGHRRVVVDLVGVRFLDSSGIAALVTCFQTVERAGGALEIFCPNGEPRRALELTGVDRLFGLDGTG